MGKTTELYYLDTVSVLVNGLVILVKGIKDNKGLTTSVSDKYGKDN
jgi:hypothetical protein